MQKNHMQLLSAAFKKTVNNFAELQCEIKTNFVKTFARQCRITGATIDEQQVERIVQENPQALQQNLFQLQGAIGRRGNRCEFPSVRSMVNAFGPPLSRIESMHVMGDCLSVKTLSVICGGSSTLIGYFRIEPLSAVV
jgi:predicted lipase